MSGPIETFRLPATWRVFFAVTQVVPPFVAIAIRLWPYLVSRGLDHAAPAPALLPVVGLTALGIVPYANTLYLSIVVVKDDGFVFNRLFKVRWDDVVAARERKVLGIPHVYVERRKGFPLWIPLYYRGDRPLRDSLRDHAPEGHPVRVCLTA